MNEELLEAGEAARYLADRWGMPSYSIRAFYKIRSRWGLTPAFSAKRSSFWHKSDLDKIPRPRKYEPQVTA